VPGATVGEHVRVDELRQDIARRLRTEYSLTSVMGWSGANTLEVVGSQKSVAGKTMDGCVI
jgi:hypothetical protein